MKWNSQNSVTNWIWRGRWKKESWETSRFFWPNELSEWPEWGLLEEGQFGERWPDKTVQKPEPATLPLQVVVYRGSDLDGGVLYKWQGELWGTSNCMSWLNRNWSINWSFHFSGPGNGNFLFRLTFQNKTWDAFFCFSAFPPLPMSLATLFCLSPLKVQECRSPQDHTRDSIRGSPLPDEQPLDRCPSLMWVEHPFSLGCKGKKHTRRALGSGSHLSLPSLWPWTSD